MGHRLGPWLKAVSSTALLQDLAGFRYAVDALAGYWLIIGRSGVRSVAKEPMKRGSLRAGQDDATA